MKVKNHLLILTVLLTSIIYGQHSDVENIYLNSTSLTSIDLSSKKITGSSYINKTFSNAQISNQKTVYSMRYNAYLDKMEVELNGQAYYLPMSSNYSITFKDLNKTYQVLDFKNKDIESKGFFVVLFAGENISLFIKEKIKLNKEVPAKLGFTKYEPPTLSRSKDKIYFILKDNLEATILPKKKKDILKLFSNNAKLVQKYAKENKLSFKNKNDLVLIFKYYNTIE